jgi:hypothetical protein
MGVAFSIGSAIGRCYYVAVNQISGLAYCGRTIDPDLLAVPDYTIRKIEAEILTGHEAVQPASLVPIRQLWKEITTEARAGKGNPFKAEREMEQALDDMCRTIEGR